MASLKKILLRIVAENDVPSLLKRMLDALEVQDVKVNQEFLNLLEQCLELEDEIDQDSDDVVVVAAVGEEAADTPPHSYLC